MAGNVRVTFHDVLLMHSYYGTVSWQILGISLASAMIAATLPFISTVLPLGVTFRAISEGFGVGLAFFGFLFWLHNQALADRWKNYSKVYLKEIELIEKPPPLSLPIYSRAGGIVLAMALFLLVLGYIFYGMSFLISIGH
jgi:hypothetical protein